MSCCYRLQLHVWDVLTGAGHCRLFCACPAAFCCLALELQLCLHQLLVHYMGYLSPAARLGLPAADSKPIMLQVHGDYVEETGSKLDRPAETTTEQPAEAPAAETTE